MNDDLDFQPFTPGHLLALDLAPQSARYADRIQQVAASGAMTVQGLSWSALSRGRVIGCAGIQQIWPGRAHAWAVIGQMPPRAWPGITRACIFMLDAAHADGWRRIETTVLDDFPAGLRWIRRLGFVCENGVTPCRAWGPDGADHWMFARVRP